MDNITDQSDYLSDCTNSDIEFLVQVLPVSKDDIFDESIPPKSGEEYLKRVKLEAMKFPHILTNKVMLNKIEPKLNLFSRNFQYLTDDRIPSKNWIYFIVNTFCDLRNKLLKIYENYKVEINDDQKIDFFQIFKNESELPLLKNILSISQDNLEKNLKLISRYLKETRKFTKHQGLWIYAFLACLKIPLKPDFYSILRDLSCVCSLIRSKLINDDNKEVIKSLNLIIYIIAKYFNQKDLCDVI